MMSLHVHQVLPKPSTGVSLPPISSLLGSVDTTASKQEHPSHETLLVQHMSGRSLPVLIPQDIPHTQPSVSPLPTSSSLGLYSHSHALATEITRSNSASSLQSNSPVIDSHATGASILSSLATIHQQMAPETAQIPPSSIQQQLHAPLPLSPPLNGEKKLRKHRCKTCDKSFTTSGHLARHSRIHTGERKHVCPYPGCQARFARQDNCMQHYRTHKATNALRRSKKKT